MYVVKVCTECKESKSIFDFPPDTPIKKVVPAKCSACCSQDKRNTDEKK